MNDLITSTKDKAHINGNEELTPIEIALGLDENGMTTARRLYEFLELAPQNYARWCKMNITENDFAEDGIDYYSSLMKSGGKGNFAEDYRLTAHFAKKLSCKGNSEKAEMARKYFVSIEEKVKQDVIDKKSLSPQLQMIGQMFEAMARQEIEQKRQAEQINRIEKRQDVIIETFQKTKDTEDFQQWANNCLSKIAENPNFNKGSNRAQKHAMVRTESYERLSAKRPCRLDDRVQKAKGRAIETNPSIKRSALEKINKIYVISNDKDLRTAYELVIKEMMMFYCVEAV